MLVSVSIDVSAGGHIYLFGTSVDLGSAIDPNRQMRNLLVAGKGSTNVVEVREWSLTYYSRQTEESQNI